MSSSACLAADVCFVCSPDKAGEASGEVTDKLGWDTYRNDWRNFFDCMLAPVAQQAAGADNETISCFKLISRLIDTMRQLEVLWMCSNHLGSYDSNVECMK